MAARPVTTSLQSPIIAIDYSLVRWSIAFSSVLMGNYLLWAIGAPAFLKIGLLVVLLSILVIFLLQNLSAHLLISLFFIIALLLLLGTPTDGWDVRSIWLFHAKRMFIDRSLYAQLDGYAPWSHNDYPGFVPTLSATFAVAMGYWNEVVPKSANVFVMLPAVCLLVSILEQRHHILLLFVLILLIGRHFIFAGWMDPLLALYTTAFASMLYLSTTFQPQNNDTHSQNWSLLVALAFTSAGLLLVKNEGSAVVLAVAVSLLISRLFLSSVINIKRSVIAAVAISAIPLAWWKIACV
ncbi:MAG: hypothetical protein WAL83_16310, partial [Arenicellales bacterium]